MNSLTFTSPEQLKASVPDLVNGLIKVCVDASERILDIYSNPETFNIQYKEDESPVTAADMASNAVLLEGLKVLTPETPILSEESTIAYADRESWQQYWLVDPIDGTKEFIAQNDEFCICLALMDGNNVLLGFIYSPVTNDYWWGGKGLDAYRNDKKIAVKPVTKQLNIIASRRFKKGNSKWSESLSAAGYSFEQISQGSALKFCRIAEGNADFYPRLGPTCEWDTAAGQGILEGAGGELLNEQGKRLNYNKESLLNPHFFAYGDSKISEILFK